MPLTLRALGLGLGLALALAVTACSGDEGDPEAAPSAPQPPPSSAAAAECAVAGHVPSDRVVLQRQRTTRLPLLLVMTHHPQADPSARNGGTR
jgi:hypothetical protein